MNTIKAVGKGVASHPLVCSGSALGGDHGQLEVAAHIDLEPLLVVVVAGCPASHEASSSLAVQSGQIRGVEFIPHGRCRDAVVTDSAALQSGRLVAYSGQF